MRPLKRSDAWSIRRRITDIKSTWIGRTCWRGLECRLRPVGSNSVRVAPVMSTCCAVTRSSCVGRWPPRKRQAINASARRCVGRPLDATPECLQFWQRECPIQCFRELRQAWQSIGRVAFHVKRGERFRQRWIEACAHRQAGFPLAVSRAGCFGSSERCQRKDGRPEP